MWFASIPRLAWASLALPLIAFGPSACGPGAPPDQGYVTPDATSQGSVAGTGGKLFVNWTLDGSAPTAALCKSIDHLTLALFYAQGRVTIDPIPCTLTRFRYDGLPPGSADLEIGGYDARGCLVLDGTARITLTQTVPASPMPTVPMTTRAGCK